VRWLLFALALLVLPAVAMGQSDTRKVAVFTHNADGSTSSKDTPTTGNTADAVFEGVSQGHAMTLHLLDRMGVPYQVFNFADSAGWGVGDGAASDSAWFREQNYMGVITVVNLPGSSSGTGDESYDYFVNETAGDNGKQAASPLSGKWSIPCVVVVVERAYRIAGQMDPGTWSFISSGAQDDKYTAAFSNGDSLEMHHRKHTIDPSQTVEVILASGDTLDGSGSFTRAWKLEDSAYFYLVGTASATGPFENPVPIIMGLSKMFDVAGYTPARKLNLHLTIDHTIPPRDNAQTDSMYAYFRALKATHSAPIETGSNLRRYQTVPAITSGGVKIRTTYDDVVRGAHPHSHEQCYGRFVGQACYPNLTAWDFSDTTTKRQRWNFQEAALSDTMYLPIPRGPYRSVLVPGGTGGGLTDLDVYIVIENGYQHLRSLSAGANGDSVGHFGQFRRIAYSGVGPTSSDHMVKRPRTQGAGGGGATRKEGQIWIQRPITAPAGADTTWGMFQTSNSDFANFYYGSLGKWLRLIGQAMAYDLDMYWHEINSLGPDDLLSPPMRRLLYLYGRCNNVMTIDARFQPTTPRRHHVSRY
jgi:hypothetical protein